MGGATCARPEFRRMMSASDRRHLAFPGVHPRRDCSGRDQDRPREMVFVVRHVLSVKTTKNPPQARSDAASLIPPESRMCPEAEQECDPGPVAGLAGSSFR
jgi:hypothetical protein